MFTSVPNDFFSEENMLKYADKYRHSKTEIPGFSHTENMFNVGIYQNQQGFSLNELRQAYPDINQEKQSIEINTHTGLSRISRLKLINGQYMENTYEDQADLFSLSEDIDRFAKKGFCIYRVLDNDQILYLTKFNIL